MNTGELSSAHRESVDLAIAATVLRRHDVYQSCVPIPTPIKDLFDKANSYHLFILLRLTIILTIIIQNIHTEHQTSVRTYSYWI